MKIKKINGHGRSEISKIIQNPFSKNSKKETEFISIAHDGFIRVWGYPSLELRK